MIKQPHRDVLANGPRAAASGRSGAVVASSAAAAQMPAEKIEVEYRELPAVVDAEAAMASDAALLYAEIPAMSASITNTATRRR